MQTHAPLRAAHFAHPPRNIAALGIQNGMSVADFGSGSGAYVLGMAERLHGAGHVYALDVQQDLLRKVKREAHKRGYTNVEVIWCDLERPRSSKIADKKIDLVLVSNLLFQVENKAAVLAEAWRILKPTGRLAIIDWLGPASSQELTSMIGPHKNDAVPKKRAMQLAEEAGFELQREFEAGAHHYGLIFTLAPKN